MNSPIFSSTEIWVVVCIRLVGKGLYPLWDIPKKDWVKTKGIARLFPDGPYPKGLRVSSW